MNAIVQLITKALETGDALGLEAGAELAQLSARLLGMTHVLSHIEQSVVEAAVEEASRCQEVEVPSQNVH